MVGYQLGSPVSLSTIHPFKLPSYPFGLSHQSHLSFVQVRGAPKGGAIWDIWTAEDEPRLSAFLWRVAAEESGDERARQLIAHPVHDANTYLSAKLRQRLWEEEGVSGYRFVQSEGEAVFIPAGCPHQVLNIRSSIKVAEDFVSPEHIRRCLRLTSQFRALPATHRRNLDGLGVKDIMLHAVSHAVSVLGDGGLFDGLLENSAACADRMQTGDNPPVSGTRAGDMPSGGTPAELD